MKSVKIYLHYPEGNYAGKTTSPLKKRAREEWSLKITDFTDHTDQPTFVVCLRPRPGIAPYRALRGALKVLGRRFGLQAISITTKKQSRVTRNATKSGSPLEL